MNWSETINKNNPIISNRLFFSASDWHWKVYINNPLVFPKPENNPSQYDFEASWRYVINKKRNLNIEITDGKTSVKRILKNRPRMVNHTFRVQFNFDKK